MAKELWAALWALPAAILCVLVLPGAAAAVTLQCVPRDAIFDSLKGSTGEVPVHVGVASNGALFEVTVSSDGTWTAFFTFPDGLSCPVATGEGWFPGGGHPGNDRGRGSVDDIAIYIHQLAMDAHGDLYTASVYPEHAGEKRGPEGPSHRRWTRPA